MTLHNEDAAEARGWFDALSEGSREVMGRFSFEKLPQGTSRSFMTVTGVNTGLLREGLAGEFISAAGGRAD
ncbi:hypothetical protein H9645_02530 [Luteimonas sp. Sa2BVA3]|uniref:PH domain-containing protein n=1 Tax=Luteimonas colneyensis TaxID=2762230 RepID=A0ABR8UFU3_9GAMM|nr:hypothetical protein [Luteimonas colneyensis]MBD7986904.1 hypothetical protein [Luteimonas colneyensis]